MESTGVHFDETGASKANYAFLQAAWQLTKDGWAKSKEYPLLATFVPLAEATTAYTLSKTGLPDFDKLESEYIKPALSSVDQTYLDVAADTTVKTYESTIAKTNEVYTTTVTTVTTTYETTTKTLVDTTEATKATLFDYVEYFKSFVFKKQSPESMTE
ncbi:hypothetical protein M885DRAFT_516258 [Pelagophyceae sp. CCMP2097]|nr:hypothetical protein M885DRAFT_516258 [Pelagophyceae sp. CCMP2097]